MSKAASLKSLISQSEHLLLNNPSFGSAERLPSHPHQPALYKITFNQVNPRQDASLRSAYFFSFDEKAQNPQLNKLPIFPLVESEIQTEIQSPQGSYRAVIRKLKDNKTVLEIWTGNNLVKSIRLSNFHGAVYDDCTFAKSTLVWSQDEKKIMYIAEKNEEKTPKFWDEFKDDEEVLKSLQNFKYRQDFGEGNVGKVNPGVFVYDIEKNDILTLEHIPENIAPAYVDFITKDGKGLVFMGVNLGAIKFGLRWCYNRDTSLYYVESPVFKKAKEEKKEVVKKQEVKGEGGESNIDSTISFKESGISADSQIENKVEVTVEKTKENGKDKDKTPPSKEALPRKLNSDHITTCPIITKDRKSLFFLYSPEKHSHLMYLGMKLIHLDENGKPSENIKTVMEPYQEPVGDFSGFVGYHDVFTKMGFLEDSKHFVFHSSCRNSFGLYIVNVQTGKVKRIDQPKLQTEEWRLLKVDGDKIVAEINDVHGTGKIGIYYGLNVGADDVDSLTKDAKWAISDYKDKVADPLGLNKSQEKINLADFGEFQEEILHIAGIESIFWTLKNYKNSDGKVVDDKDKPLLLFLHGGPHSVTTGFYSIFRHLALIRGYNILSPNYTGSEGFGQKFIDGLLGRIGQVDIEEIDATVQHVITKGLCNPKRIACMGGSYGGCLSGVLPAKFPDVYKASIMRNPVVSMPFLVEGGDIPEWNYAEVFGTGMNFSPTPEELKRLYEKSPLCMAKNVKASVMLMLGGADIRVPAGGAINYYKIMKGQGKDVRLAWYPEEAHGLTASAEVEMDNAVKVMAFLEEKNV